MLLDHISQNLYGLDNGYLAMIDLGIIALLVENLVYILVWLWLNVYWVWFWFSERFLRMVYESMIDLGCRWVYKVMSISMHACLRVCRLRLKLNSSQNSPIIT